MHDKIIGKLVATVVGTAATVGVAACGGAQPSASTATIHPTTTTTYTSIPGHEGSNEGADLGNTSGSVSGEDNFIHVLDYYGIQCDRPQVIGVGHAVCDGLAHSSNTSAGMMRGIAATSNGYWDFTQASEIVGAAVGNFCPQYRYLLK